MIVKKIIINDTSLENATIEKIKSIIIKDRKLEKMCVENVSLFSILNNLTKKK